MHAVIGRVNIKPGHEDETQAMIADLPSYGSHRPALG
jgi:hypothetical protein